MPVGGKATIEWRRKTILIEQIEFIYQIMI